MMKPVEDTTNSDGIGYYYTTPTYGSKIYASSLTGFGEDTEEGHGTHTAGSAAGATLNSPADAGSCSEEEELGCIGGCVSEVNLESMLDNNELDWDALCPQHECDGLSGSCLGEDVAETLTSNGGVAQGAKLTIFDASADGDSMWTNLALNGLWDATSGTNAFLHSNSLGGDGACNVDSECITYDQYMYDVSGFLDCGHQCCVPYCIRDLPENNIR